MDSSKERIADPSFDVAAFILAGGESRRMGRDKALLELHGIPMVVRACQLAKPHVISVSVVGPPERYQHLGLTLIPDRWSRVGPLGGISTALGNTVHEWNFILGCDLPFLTSSWIRWFIGRAMTSKAQAVLPESLRGTEPLAAMYRRSCGPILANAVEKGIRRVLEGISFLEFERVDSSEWGHLDDRGTLFQNVNTPEDFEVARSILESKK